MPLIFEKSITATKKLGVWEITEPIDFFISQIETEISEELSEKRKQEKAVSSFLLNHLSGEKLDLYLSKNEFGKPIVQTGNWGISFSHSQNMIACMIDSKGASLGIDIEKSRETISKIAHKFINSSDTSPEKDLLLNQHLIWGAKEVLYKVYGRKQLDFKRDLYTHNNGYFCGQIVKNTYNEIYSIDYQLLNDYILVWNGEILSKYT